MAREHAEHFWPEKPNADVNFVELFLLITGPMNVLSTVLPTVNF